MQSQRSFKSGKIAFITFLCLVGITLIVGAFKFCIRTPVVPSVFTDTSSSDFDENTEKWGQLGISEQYPQVLVGGVPYTCLLYTSAPEVIRLASRYLRFNLPFYFPLAVLFVYRSALQGIGQNFAPVFSGCIELVCKTAIGLGLSGLLGDVYKRQSLYTTSSKCVQGIPVFREIRRARVDFPLATDPTMYNFTKTIHPFRILYTRS